MDVYTDTLNAQAFHANGSYDSLIALGKPFALTEIGPLSAKGEFDAVQVLSAIQQHTPAATYALWWHSWGSGFTRNRKALVDNPNWRRMLSSEWMINMPQCADRPTDDNPLRRK